MESPFDMQAMDEPKALFVTAGRIIHWERPPDEMLTETLLTAEQIRYWGDRRDGVYTQVLLMALRTYEELLGGVRGSSLRGERVPDFSFDMQPQPCSPLSWVPAQRGRACLPAMETPDKVLAMAGKSLGNETKAGFETPRRPRQYSDRGTGSLDIQPY